MNKFNRGDKIICDLKNTDWDNEIGIITEMQRNDFYIYRISWNKVKLNINTWFAQEDLRHLKQNSNTKFKIDDWVEYVDDRNSHYKEKGKILGASQNEYGVDHYIIKWRSGWDTGTYISNKFLELTVECYVCQGTKLKL